MSTVVEKTVTDVQCHYVEEEKCVTVDVKVCNDVTTQKCEVIDKEVTRQEEKTICDDVTVTKCDDVVDKVCEEVSKEVIEKVPEEKCADECLPSKPKIQFAKLLAAQLFLIWLHKPKLTVDNPD